MVAELTAVVALMVFICVVVGAVSYHFGWQRGFDAEFSRHMDMVEDVLNDQMIFYRKLQDVNNEYWEDRIRELTEDG